MRMTFLVNTSPFAGREGKYVTSRNIKERLQRELERNLVRAEQRCLCPSSLACLLGTSLLLCLSLASRG